MIFFTSSLVYRGTDCVAFEMWPPVCCYLSLSGRFLSISGLRAAAVVLDELVPYPTAAQMGEGGLDRHDVPGIDRAFMHDFDYELQNLGHVLLTATMLMPLASVAGGDVADAVRIGALFGQTMLLSYGSKGALVHVFPRHRPHTYFHGTPRAYLEDDGSRKSFFSGHTSHSFAAATFSTVVFADLYPESRYRYLVGVTAYGLSSAVGVSRVLAGRHFVSDVVVGAAWGSLVGWLVPHLYQQEQGSQKLRVMPMLYEQGPGVVVSYALS